MQPPQTCQNPLNLVGVRWGRYHVVAWLLSPVMPVSVAPFHLAVDLTGTIEADPLKRADGRRIVGVAAGDDEPNVRLGKCSFDKCSCRLCGIAATAPIWDYAVPDFDGARIIWRTLETDVADNGSTRALDHHPNAEGFRRGRRRRS